MEEHKELTDRLREGGELEQGVQETARLAEASEPDNHIRRNRFYQRFVRRCGERLRRNEKAQEYFAKGACAAYLGIVTVMCPPMGVYMLYQGVRHHDELLAALRADIHKSATDVTK
jgi:hypothetical protein